MDQQYSSAILSDLEDYLSDKVWNDYGNLAIEISNLRMERSILRTQIHNLKQIASNFADKIEYQAFELQNQKHAITKLEEENKHLRRQSTHTSKLQYANENYSNIVTEIIDVTNDTINDTRWIEKSQHMGEFGDSSIEYFCNKYEEILDTKANGLVSEVRFSLGRGLEPSRRPALPPPKPKRSLGRRKECATQTDLDVVCFVKEDLDMIEEIENTGNGSMDVSVLSEQVPNNCLGFSMFRFTKRK